MTTTLYNNRKFYLYKEGMMILQSFFSLILPSYMIVPIKDQENTTFSTLAIIISDLIINLPAPVEMDIDDFNISNINNYNDVRGCTMFSNKATSRMVSMSSSKVSEDYATRVECSNNIPNDKETRKPINSSQLSYMEHRKTEI